MLRTTSRRSAPSKLSATDGPVATAPCAGAGSPPPGKLPLDQLSGALEQLRLALGARRRRIRGNPHAALERLGGIRQRILLRLLALRATAARRRGRGSAATRRTRAARRPVPATATWGDIGAFFFSWGHRRETAADYPRCVDARRSFGGRAGCAAASVRKFRSSSGRATRVTLAARQPASRWRRRRRRADAGDRGRGCAGVSCGNALAGPPDGRNAASRRHCRQGRRGRAALRLPAAPPRAAPVVGMRRRPGQAAAWGAGGTGCVVVLGPTATLRTSSSDSSPRVSLTRSALTVATSRPLSCSPWRTTRDLPPLTSLRNAICRSPATAVPVSTN